MGKSLISEKHPLYVGEYNGDFSEPEVLAIADKADCMIVWGSLPTDLNTAGFTIKRNPEFMIEIHTNYVNVHHATYPHLYINSFGPAFIRKTKGLRFSSKIVRKRKKLEKTKVPQKLNHAFFWKKIEKILPKKSTVIAETGTSLFAFFSMRLPADSSFIGQVLWCSIGYSVGALLGACIAEPQKPTFLFVGDGSFQLTAQEVSTILRHNLSPVIFLINNKGYTIERVIHGMKASYNDIANWNYTSLVKAFEGKLWTKKVSTPRELDRAFKELPKHKKLSTFY